MDGTVDSNGEPVLLDVEAVSMIAQALAGGVSTGNGSKPSLALPAGAQGTGRGHEDERPHRRIVASSTLLGPDAWTYSLKHVCDGASGHHGLIGYGDAEDGRNTWESLTKAGYESTSVTGLKPIPNGAIVTCWYTLVGANSMLTFSERNEPICT